MSHINIRVTPAAPPALNNVAHNHQLQEQSVFLPTGTLNLSGWCSADTSRLKHFYISLHFMCPVRGRDSAVGIAPRYGLDGPRSNPGGGEFFRTNPNWPRGPPSLLYNEYRFFPGGKSAGAWRWTPTPSSTEVKERVELFHYFPYVPSWPVIGWPLPLTLFARFTLRSVFSVSYPPTLNRWRGLTARSTVRANHMQCPLVHRCYIKRRILTLEICELC
jgi:hypothetical protein